MHVGNSWRDRAGDRLNRKGGAVAEGRLGGRALLALAGGSLGISLLAASAPGVTMEARVLLAAALLLGAAYVTPPVEAKRRPGLDLLSQALGYGLVAYLLGAVSMPPERGLSAGGIGVESVPAFALGIATVGLLTMLADRPGDEAAGQRTTAVALGEGRSRAAALALAIATAAAGLAACAWAPAMWGLVAAAWLGLEPTRGDWNRDAVVLQTVFLVLLLPSTPVPAMAALLLGGASALYDRSLGGAGYPLRAGRGPDLRSADGGAEISE